ncbi:MAG: amidohydrolase family protein [Gammaproteobacteria bacterium]|nr:amidohydrolase family protein [Gammaproteobacteria bacterium]
MNTDPIRLPLILLSALLTLGGCGESTNTPSGAPGFDILLLNGSVYRGGAGRAFESVDVGIRNGEIAYIGNAHADGVDARRRLDATGLIVAPGFIDPHTHALNELRSATANSNLNYLMQGVTTVFTGNDGEGPASLEETIEHLNSNGIGTNAALYVGHGSLRNSVMGGAYRAPTAEELEQMKSLVANAMESGALGLSTGLYYVPGYFAGTEEVIALARVAAEYGGIYDTHLRDESTYNIGLIAAIDEALRIGREARIPVNIAHIKALGVDVWGESARVIERIEQARKAGQRVTADQYPWPASGTHLRNTLLPRAVLAGAGTDYFERLRAPRILAKIRPEMQENLRRRGGPDSLLIIAADNPDIVGRTLAEIAGERGEDPIDTAVDIMTEGSTRVASFNMHADDIRAFMQQEWVMTSSDGTDGHPRKYASFPKKYRDYVLGEQLLSLEDFLYRSSGLTAETFGLAGRGRIEIGYVADVVAFDPETFAPVATFAAWNELSEGLVYSIVNGQLVVDKGKYTGILPGIVLRKRNGRS